MFVIRDPQTGHIITSNKTYFEIVTYRLFLYNNNYQHSFRNVNANESDL